MKSYTVVDDVNGDMDFLYQGDDLNKAVKVLQHAVNFVFEEWVIDQSFGENRSFSLIRDPLDCIIQIKFEVQKVVQ